MTCTCDGPSADAYVDGDECPIHVQCDDDCKALNDPTTLEELRAALDHWADHSWLHGCSHGC